MVETKVNKAEIIEEAVQSLLSQKIDTAAHIISSRYPFRPNQRVNRSYSILEKAMTFYRDGFIDRYTGDKLVHPEILRILSLSCPNEFPYQKHWKLNETHIAYWELMPTIDHITPIALGGKDNMDNWITTSMLHNQIKSSWTLEQLNWVIQKEGNIEQWDGLTSLFFALIQNNSEYLKDSYVKSWYQASVKVFQK